MLKIRPIIILIIIVLSIAVAGCSRYTLLNSETYHTSLLKDQKTFRIVNTDEGNIPPGLTVATYYDISNLIREQLKSRGYSEDPNSPMYVNFGFTIAKNIETEPVTPPNYFPFPGPFPGPGYYPYFMYPRQNYWRNQYPLVVTDIYKQGVLTMDIVYIPDKELLYTASVSSKLSKSNGYGDYKQLSQAVNSLFVKFPSTK